MKLLRFCSILFTVSFAFLLNAEEASFHGRIKVLLKKDIEGAVVEAVGPFRVMNQANNKSLSSGYRGKRFFMHMTSEGIKWGETFYGAHQLRIEPTSPETYLLVDGMQYRGGLDVYAVDERIHIVNHVEIDDYLTSILTNRLAESQMHESALDAACIAERTGAYYRTLHGQSPFWDVDAESVQYTGQGTTLMDLCIEKAVEDTKGLIMTYKDKPFPTELTSHSAGSTASYEAIYRTPSQSPKGVEVPLARKNRGKVNWSFHMHQDELAQIAKTNRITGIDLYIDQGSHKAYAVRVRDGSHNRDYSISHFIRAIGRDRLKSNDFSVKLDKDKIVFEGYGAGLGVGLCLYSAEQMAELGHTSEEILMNFFPNTSVYRLGSTDA